MAAAVVLKVPTVRKIPAAMAFRAKDRRNGCGRGWRLARVRFAAGWPCPPGPRG